MTALAVIVAIIDNGKVLLTKREDFEVWCLPGGSVEAGESLAAAGIREAKEETGLDVELTRLVGVYSRLGGGLPDVHSVLYAAKPVGGELRFQPNETIEVAFFPSTGCLRKCYSVTGSASATRSIMPAACLCGSRLTWQIKNNILARKSID